MEPTARDSYLVTEVMTASPQKLQLMMIDAAIRSAERAGPLWRAAADEKAGETLIHAQKIVAEMLSSLNRDGNPALVDKMAAVYTFLFRTLMEANYHRDEQKLADALRVLRTERETWRAVCEQTGDTSSTRPTPPNDQPPSAGLSLEI